METGEGGRRGSVGRLGKGVAKKRISTPENQSAKPLAQIHLIVRNIGGDFGNRIPLLLLPLEEGGVEYHWSRLRSFYKRFKSKSWLFNADSNMY